MPPRKKPQLRSVAPGEAPAAVEEGGKATISTVSQAIAASERDVLVALRRKIAADIDNGVPAHALAGLAKQLLELDQKIRVIDVLAAAEAEGKTADGGEDEGPASDEAFDASAI